MSSLASKISEVLLMMCYIGIVWTSCICYTGLHTSWKYFETCDSGWTLPRSHAVVIALILLIFFPGFTADPLELFSCRLPKATLNAKCFSPKMVWILYEKVLSVSCPLMQQPWTDASRSAAMWAFCKLQCSGWNARGVVTLFVFWVVD